MRVVAETEKDSVRAIMAPLLTDEKAILKRMVEKSLGLFRIDNSTGDLVLVIPRTKITDKEYLGLLLVARFLAFKAGLAKQDSMTLSELVEKSGITESTASTRLSDLKADRVAESVSRGEYRVSYANAERFLQDVSLGLEKNERGDVEKESPTATENYPKIGKPSGVRDAILKVLSTPWGKRPRTWREIYDALKSNDYYYGEGNVSGSLTQLVKELKKVRRVKLDKKTGYVLDE
jgi:hypothetical protein